MSPQTRPHIARCPECDSRIYFDRSPDLGQILACPECDTSLEVISANPVRLDWAYDEGDRFFESGSGRDESDDLFELEDESLFDDEDEDW